MMIESCRSVLPASAMVAVLGALACSQVEAVPGTPADLTITNTVLRTKDQMPPLGANDFGHCGAIEWAANNFISNSGNEPIYWQYMHRTAAVGQNWFEIDGPGVSNWDLWGNGLFSGASLRIYRIVDAAGNSLPLTEDYLDMSDAHHVQFVGNATVVPAGDATYPAGGWVVTTYGSIFPCDNVQATNTGCIDYNAVDNGQTYWYTVVAYDVDDNISGYSNEVSVTPQSGATGGFHIVGEETVSGYSAGDWFGLYPSTVGGQEPYQWELLTESGSPQTPPAGLEFDSTYGELSGSPTSTIVDFRFMLRVTDSTGATATRNYTINPNLPASADGSPAPPSNLQVTAGDDYVSLQWNPSPSADVVRYELLRSTAPASQQEQRVYLSPGAPALHPYDYVIVEKRFDNFDMKHVHPRVRGRGNPADEPGWYWNADLELVDFSLVQHPQPVPAEMIEPGETCLRIDAVNESVVMNQLKFIGTDIPEESEWYAHLEPGQQYRAEFWMRQEGISESGLVRFDIRSLDEFFPYPTIGADFNVTGQWDKYVYDFVAPSGAAPTGVWHYGPALAFTGPGSLWIDNCRVYRWDSPQDRDALYVPNATVFDELVASQPRTGKKGMHRIWFLQHNTTMDHMLSWHSNSHVSIDWITSVNGTNDMTLPMGLEFDFRTGDRPETRMRPWLVVQHILHDEQDWLNLIEYLAAPYDPATDTPESKPYAYKRYMQRGFGTPWVDEFSDMMIEFGNETWHNGLFADWIGFHKFSYIMQGGPEYGLFSQYLIDTIKSSPYWTSQNLDHKIRFSLGGDYDTGIDEHDRVWGYVEEAKQNCPDAHTLGHANYVGPKWETEDEQYSVFDDYGVQETLVGYLTSVEPRQLAMRQSKERLEELGMPYDLVAYEGGPSGYAIPGTEDSEEQVETSERYGKSLAMGVSCLDAWMCSYRDGWTEQCYLGFVQGSHWSSHTPIQNGFRPTPGWQVLTMRNQYASGALMDVSVNTTPTFERLPGEEVPLIGAYAMNDETTWSVFVISRKLEGVHNGTDFGNGYSPVTLNLPFETATRIELHTLTGDPRESNRFAMNIDTQSQTIPANALTNGVFTINENTGGTANGMPPGSIYLYVFELTDTPDGDADGDGDVDLEDAALFSLCQSGVSPSGTADCQAMDFNKDGEIGIGDLAGFAECMAGPDTPPSCR